ncbi:MAG: hypothetical protein ACREB3_13580, partial [Burkholderiales bacterium]
MLGNFFKTELANFSKTDELLGVNEDPMLLELAGQLKDADKEKTRLEADEVRLKSILRWGKIDEPGRTRPATDADVAEANARLKADLGVTLPSHFYLPEARAAKAHREKLQAEYEQLGKQSRERLRPQLC